MKKTKIAGLGVIVLVVVALAGCNLFGDSRGPGFGYVPLRPPVDESVAGTSLSTNTIAQSVGVFNVIQSSTPEEQASDEYNRLTGALDSVDSEMESLDSRAQEEGDRPCLESNLSVITLTIPDMGDEVESLTAQIQCAEIRTGGGADYLAVYFGFDNSGDESVFYLIEMQEFTDANRSPAVQMHHVRYASRNLGTDEVIFRQITMHDEGVTNEPDLSDAWNLEVTSIVARPKAQDGDKFILYSVREKENDSIDVTIAYDGNEPSITAGDKDDNDTKFSVNGKNGAAVTLIQSVRNESNGLSDIAPF